MENLDVRHYLDIYTIRKEMQESGITNPREEIKEFVKEFVDKLEKLPLDMEIFLEDNSFFDKDGLLIMEIPY